MDQLNFNDIFKNSFIAMQGSMERYSIADVLLNLGITFLMAMFLFYIYRRTFQGVLYQHSFNVSLVAISMIVAMVIMTISGNLVLSLGMVGALSIVRFRTAIKDPVDLVFIFWAISIGIANGVAYYNISLVTSVAIAAVLLGLRRKGNFDSPYLLVLQYENGQQESEILRLVNERVVSCQLKSKSVQDDYSELTLEVRLRGGNGEFLDEMKALKSYRKATLISVSGELFQF